MLEFLYVEMLITAGIYNRIMYAIQQKLLPAGEI
jgi:hypothetical protein